MTTKDVSEPALGGLGKTSSQLLVTLAGRGQRLFTTGQAREVVGGSMASTRKLLHDMVQRGWLYALGRGRYLIIPLEAGPHREYAAHEFLVAAHLCPGSYIAYWTALHYHNLTEQIPTSVFAATTRRCPTAEIAGVRYIFVTLRPYKVFAQQTIWVEGQAVAVSNVEKTLVDALDHPEHCGGIVEVAKGLHTAWFEGRIELDRLTTYARQMGNRAILKRLGYLAERLELPAGELLSTWQQEISPGYALLDPSRTAAGIRNRRWQVQANVAVDELIGWMEH